MAEIVVPYVDWYRLDRRVQRAVGLLHNQRVDLMRQAADIQERVTAIDAAIDELVKPHDQSQ